MPKILKLNSPLGKQIRKLEQHMDEQNIRIEGWNLKICVDGVCFNIGRDQDQFPRSVDEAFWRENE